VLSPLTVGLPSGLVERGGFLAMPRGGVGECAGSNAEQRFFCKHPRIGPGPMVELACLNGEVMPVENARVPVWDRGFLFGDSVYEVCRIYRGRCWLEKEHMARLRRSLKELEFPAYDLDSLIQRMHNVIAASRIQEGIVYMQITRGVAPRMHAFPDPPVPPTELIVVRPYDDGPTVQLRQLGVRAISHPDLRWKRCDIKTTNLLGNVLANEKAHRAGCYEAILVDPDGFITEATHTSLLWVRDGRLEGTPEGHEILPGMTRQFTLRLVEKLALPFAATRIALAELFACEEVVLVGTTSEVLSIIQIDGRTIGTGGPGPVAQRLWTAYQSEVEHWLTSGKGTV
jgi:D-alanine transaminase